MPENDCTEPNRKDCPRLCQSFCNKRETELAMTEDRLQRLGYSLEELKLDNPYNQWMYDGQ